MNLDGWIAQQENAAAGVISEVLTHLPASGMLYDVGANVGVVTAAALRAGHRVVAFEPHPDRCAVLRRRCPTASIYTFALGAEFETKTLYCDEESNLGWNTFIGERAELTMVERQVEVRPLDSLEPQRIDVLKIDVEGAEADVIAGATQTIQNLHPVIVMELGWGKNHPDWQGQVGMMEWLFSVGYERIPYELDGTGDVTLVHA